MESVLWAATLDVLSWQVLLIIALSAIYGIFVGAIPGLTATMAVALVMPLTFYLDDVQAIAAIVTTVTCSIFAGDIPAILVRIPGTPASAAYAADGYALTQLGRHSSALMTSLIFSVAGGLFGTVVLACAAPMLANVATQFTSYEYFWLYLLGLTCAVVVAGDSRTRGAIALLIGLLLSSVGLATDFSTPRLTFGMDQLISGVNFIPAMIGLFGISEVLRIALVLPSESATETKVRAETPNARQVLAEVLPLAWQRKFHLLRSSCIGSFIGMLPGAGADIASWISYALSKKFSRTPGEYGHGSLEGLGDATGANNAALGGAWIPALVFGIPGDSVTAIAIGVLLMKNITPGPAIFDAAEQPTQATLVASIFITFVIANLMLIPIGIAAIRAGAFLIRIPRRILLPLILLFCMVGSYAMSCSYFDIWLMLALGLLGFALEKYRFPLGPVVLGLILGNQVEHRFIQCITKSSDPMDFFGSSISVSLGVVCILLWCAPLLSMWQRNGKQQLDKPRS